MRNLLSPMLAAALILSSAAISKADEVNLTAVNNQFSITLKDVARFANADNLHVIPMRTNAELELIAVECETILSQNDTDAEVPSICAAIDLPFDGANGDIYEFASNEFAANEFFTNVEFRP